MLPGYIRRINCAHRTSAAKQQTKRQPRRGDHANGKHRPESGEGRAGEGALATTTLCEWRARRARQGPIDNTRQSQAPRKGNTSTLLSKYKTLPGRTSEPNTDGGGERRTRHRLHVQYDSNQALPASVVAGIGDDTLCTGAALQGVLQRTGIMVPLVLQIAHPTQLVTRASHHFGRRTAVPGS